MEQDVKAKVILGLERISEAYKALLWEKAKNHGLSPIQIQLLLFIADHKPALCNVSHLAREFNLTKPTISDAIRVLHKKELLEKDHSSSDSRSYTLFVTPAGQEMIAELNAYARPIDQALDGMDDQTLNALYSTLTRLVFQLNCSGILRVQRTCFACRFYEKVDDGHYCRLLQTSLVDRDIRLDCPEFEAQA